MVITSECIYFIRLSTGKYLFATHFLHCPMYHIPISFNINNPQIYISSTQSSQYNELAHLYVTTLIIFPRNLYFFFA